MVNISESTKYLPRGLAQSVGRQRNSNIELYRIIVMLFIVAHHYVVNSGLIDVLKDQPFSVASVSMLLFGAWGKTGINCFVMITGWFMCKSRFTIQKFLKLYFQIVFYGVLIYGIFCFTGHESFHTITALLKLFPVKSIADGFGSCFLIFFLLIPFINILIENLNKRMHATLLLVLLTVYTILPTFPAYRLSFNYVSWFTILYLTASYLRFYGFGFKLSNRIWGWVTLLLVAIASSSVLFMYYMYQTGHIGAFNPYFFISDSNKILAYALGVSSFMFFKDLHIPQSRLINAMGGATFGVLLIHANSDAMRQWLWRETVDCVGHYGEGLLYSVATIIIVFVVCCILDILRNHLVEPILMDITDNVVAQGKKVLTGTTSI